MQTTHRRFPHTGGKMVVYGQIKIKLMTIFFSICLQIMKVVRKGEPFNGSMENENATQIQFKFNVCGSSRIKSQMFLKFHED